MVALTSRFAALSAFVALASFSFAPIPTVAMAIPKPGPPGSLLPAGSFASPAISSPAAQAGNQKEARSLGYTQNVVEFARAVSKKSLHQRPRSRSLTPNKQAVFSVHRRHAEAIGEQGILGEVSIIGTKGNVVGKLVATLKEGSCILGAAEDNFTPMTLLPRPSSRAKSAGSVILQVPDCEDPSVQKCVTYDCATPGPFTLKKCAMDEAGTSSQSFTYNKATGSLEPNECTSAPVDPSSQPQNVFQGEETVKPQPQNVKLKFGPLKPANAQEMAPSAEASTTTTTVTVTGSPTASFSAAAETDATLSDSAGSSSVLSSTADPSKPTASAAAPAFVVLEGSSLSNATATATSEPAATPSTTMSIEDIASSIAASTVTDAPLAPTATANATSSAAVAMDVSSSLPMTMSSSTESSAPTASADSLLYT